MKILSQRTASRLVNVSLQAATLSSRFIFIFFLAKYLNPSEVGYFGLFTATVGYSLYFVGLDFYTYATREMVNTPTSERGKILKGQAALSGVLYIFFFPIAYALLYFYVNLPIYLLAWFLPILLLEHFNQEMSRLLVALSEQVTASVVLFIRHGTWSLATIAVMYWSESSQQLTTVVTLWALTGLLAMLVSLRKLQSLQLGGWLSPLDWNWIQRGVVVSATFLLATLALRGIQTLDRFWLEAIGGIEMVGAYVLFIGVAGSLLAFLDAGVFSFAYPNLISMNKEKKYDAARKSVRRMLSTTLLLSIAFSIISWIILPYLLKWIDRSTYTAAIFLYPWILLATILNAIGLVPHYALYAAGQDRPIIMSHIASLFVFCIALLALHAKSGVSAVPQALAVSFLLILIWKFNAYRQHLLRIAARDVATCGS